MRRRIVTGCLVVVVLGCTENAALDVIELTPTVIGIPTVTRLETTKNGRSLRDAEFVSVSDSTMRLDNWPLRAAATITYAPQRPGEHRAEATLIQGGRERRIPVVARAVDPATCPIAGSCENLRATADGRCFIELKPDETACAAPCVMGGVCRAGICEGPPPPCDDGNECTDDRCLAHISCWHFPITDEQCSGGMPRCQGYGTTCGAALCGMRGRCGEDNVCRQTLHEDVFPCRGPDEAGTRVTATWEWRDEGRELVALALDEEGRPWSLACGPSPGPTSNTCALVALERSGRERFRIPFDTHPRWHPMIVGDGVYVTTARSVLRLRTSDGGLDWAFSPTDAELPAFAEFASPAIRLDALTLRVEFSETPSCDLCDPVFGAATLRLNDGTLASSSRGAARALIARASDGNGHAFELRSNGAQDGAVLHAENVQPPLNLGIPETGRWDLATHPLHFLVGGMATLDIADGRVTPDSWRGTPGSIIWTGLSGWEVLTAPCDTVQVRAFRIQDGGTHRTCSIGQGSLPGLRASHGDPIALEYENALVPTFRSDGIRLDVIGRGEGYRRFDVPVAMSAMTPPQDKLQLALADEQFFVAGGDTLTSYPLEGIRPAKTGWITRHGNFGRDGTPR